MSKIKLKPTQRGFLHGDFKDRYGHSCSIQKSSIATEDCIWFGINDADPKILVEGQGWQPVPFPEGTSFHTRMHLTREMVKDLLPILQKFAKTGEI